MNELALLVFNDEKGLTVPAKIESAVRRFVAKYGFEPAWVLLSPADYASVNGYKHPTVSIAPARRIRPNNFWVQEKYESKPKQNKNRRSVDIQGHAEP